MSKAKHGKHHNEAEAAVGAAETSPPGKMKTRKYERERPLNERAGLQRGSAQFVA
jgi:hypothetical protein